MPLSSAARSELQAVFDSCSFTHQFKLNFEATKNVDIGHFVSSDDISAGGYLWKIRCYPRGGDSKDKGEYLGVFLQHESETEDVKAIFEVFVMDRDGVPSSSHIHRFVHVYRPKGTRTVLESLHVINGSVIIMCGVKVLHEDPISVPASDIASHIGSLLESTDGSNVTFVVDGEEFPAHQAVLAARSPVFKAQLLGSMADAKMASITLQGIAPATFKAMLQFIYTDDLPGDEEDGDEEVPTEAFEDLLAAADRFALDRLKLMCAKKLWDGVSTDTTYSCPELKMKCLDFFTDEKNFKEALRVKVVGS
ncbi:hypothetical protein HU200_061888 [Digitaria exilis]|uniref:Uncharacterized protein n=1 Tax=Digitaria exilis TaxID=1010633 RepID=A0A835E0V2_9POAL|nr:hypothetical protein HU200_061888 [Digitaria exilis]